MLDPDTRLASLVRVRQSGIRSINIERDLRQPSFAYQYVLTAQARRTLTRVLDSIDGVTQARAWTLTGPYGSGKSYFALFAMSLLGDVVSTAHQEAVARLEAADPLLFQRVRATIGRSGIHGLLPVPITGYRAPIQQVLVNGFSQALEPFRSNAAIDDLLNSGESLIDAGSRALVEWVDRLVCEVSQSIMGFSGVLLLLDEMGKLLEYAAAHPDTTDLYLLQELAEYANRSRQTPFLMMGILHQAFERYAVILDSATQREWAKVQGRFEDIAFQEPPDQQMRLLVNALEHVNGSFAPAGLTSYIDTAVAGGWLPPLMQPDEFVGLCQEAQPFHPTSLVALPYLFRRLAQNERSIFAYLASQEPFGFQEFLHSHSAQETIRLSHLFDYLVANFQGRLYASLRARPLTETLERVNNGHSLSPLTTDLMKTIGLLNWLGEISPFQATEARVFSAVRSSEYSDDEIRKALQSLQTRSYIVHRRFNDTYSVWQGSDVDIEQRLEEARQRLRGSFSLAETVQRYLPPRPIVASRHSYQTDAMRHFEVRYVDQALRDQLSLQPDAAASGMLLVCLPAGRAEAESFAQWAAESSLRNRSDVIVCVVERTMRLAELATELRCLQWVREHTPELRDDPVARRELRARVAMIENLIRNELDFLLASSRLAQPAANTWFYNGEQLASPQSLSHLLSSVCDELYPCTPRLWNELINRRTLSSQGAAARRNLIEAMLEKAGQATDIEGFPPKRRIYQS